MFDRLENSKVAPTYILSSLEWTSKVPLAISPSRAFVDHADHTAHEPADWSAVPAHITQFILADIGRHFRLQIALAAEAHQGLMHLS
ncbi:MAG: hypothetical protein V8R75_02640 [Oscillospiraceae bacterium]